MVGAGKGLFGPFGRFAGGTIRRSRLLKQPLITFIADGPYQDQLTTLRDLIEAGKVTPVIDRTYALADIGQAISYAATERARGKIVVTVADA